MKHLSVIIVAVTLSFSMALGQNQMIDKVNLVDRSNSKFITINKPGSLSSGLRLIFPSAAGSADQVLAISAVAGTDVTLGWVTMSSGTSTSSDRLTSDETVTPPAVPTGLVVACGANKTYRVVATVRCNRLDAGGSDNIKFKLSGPTGSSYVALGVSCLDNSATSAVYSSASSADNVTTGSIDPPSYDQRSYSVDGIVITGSSTGNVTLTVIDGAGTATTDQIKIWTHSNMVLREIE